jgi:hypothetical protein
VRTAVLGEEQGSQTIRALRREIHGSTRVKALLGERDAEGRIPFHPYGKWFGAHWVLAALADIGYPPGDASLHPLRDQVYGWLLSEDHLPSVQVLNGRPRRHASQEGNALWSTLRLGVADERADRLARNLIGWQWPDGGWNCDKNPSAHTSSFHETLLPLRALALYGRERSDEGALDAARRAAEVFLSRRLFRRRTDGSVIAQGFVKLHYPSYWHYDVLAGLKVTAEAGFLADPRCAEALDLLESKRLADGGFATEGRYYRTNERRMKSGRRLSGYSLVDWGGASSRRTNEWVTAQALAVLRAAGRAA